MLTVHHLGISQSDRIVWLCEELEIPYDLVHYERDPVTRFAPAEYSALHPFGTAPVITDDDLVLGESAAIIDYITHGHGAGRLTVEPGAPGYTDYLYWFHFANGSFMPALMVELATAGQPESDMVRLLKDRTRRAFDLVEQRLGEADYFAGDEFTAADIIMAFPLTTMRRFIAKDIASYPNLRAYLRRIGARPAFQRAMAKADPELPPNLT